MKVEFRIVFIKLTLGTVPDKRPSVDGLYTLLNVELIILNFLFTRKLETLTSLTVQLIISIIDAALSIVFIKLVALIFFISTLCILTLVLLPMFNK